MSVLFKEKKQAVSGNKGAKLATALAKCFSIIRRRLEKVEIKNLICENFHPLKHTVGV